MNILYIILKHVIWRFRSYNFSREIFKFRENTSKTNFEKSLKVFIKLRNLYISRKNYINGIYRLRASKLYIICSYFKSLKFFRTPIPKFKLNWNLQTIPLKMMSNMSCYIIRSQMNGGGGRPEPPSSLIL